MGHKPNSREQVVLTLYKFKIKKEQFYPLQKAYAKNWD